MKGWIALDIDGTVTDKTRPVPLEVASYLKSLVEDGWRIAFLTGRTFSFAIKSLTTIPFPYLIGVQNGSDVIEMPSQRVKARTYLKKEILKEIEPICKSLHEDYIIYAGYERGDFCYYRPKRFSPKLLEFLDILKTLSKEPWRAVDDFPLNELNEFPLIKCFGTKEQMESLQPVFDQHKTAKATMIRDPMLESLYLQLITSRSAGKGKVIQDLIKEKRVPVIAAGDDRNDVEMLKMADVKIVMAGAPEEMHKLADIHAKSAAELGIIDALKEAVTRIKT